MSESAPVFRLERVLRHRQESELQRERELALALADLDAQEHVLRAACTRHESALDRMRVALSGERLSASALVSIHADQEHSAVSVSHAREAVSHRAEGVEQARADLVVARQAREVISRLKSRYLARARDAHLRAEQREMDQIAQVAHWSAKSSATPPGPAYTPSTQTSKDVLM